MSASNGHTVRRSSRVPVKVPVRVTSLGPNAQFSEICETLEVSAHGCALRFPVKLDAGNALRLHSRGGRQATAYVVFCQPMGSDGQGFRLGARLDQPENFWGLESYPDDWRVVEMPAAAQQTAQKLSASSAVLHKPQTLPWDSQAILNTLKEQLSEDRLRGIVADLVRPMQAEVTEIRKKQAASAERNRFEVSLGYIPPELEEKLWERLRQDLGTRVLQQTREQSAEILGSAKTTIEQKIGAALTEFRHSLAGELHTVEQRAQVLSKELTSTTQQHVRAGVEKLQRQALDTGAHLNAEGEKLLSSLQGQLVDSQEAHRREIERIQADSAARASHLQVEVLDLSGRTSALNESVRRLESELDAHLEGIAREIVSAAEARIEGAMTLALKELQARGSNEAEARLSDMCGNMRTIQNRIESSFSGSLTAQGEEALQSSAERFEQLAQQSLEKWRLTLAKNLNTVANTLGQQLRQEVEPEAGQS
jgi:hypothetical protein